ncbi:hypothetical protein BaRGS_00012452, partial [Batillaria attramentaria]
IVLSQATLDVSPVVSEYAFLCVPSSSKSNETTWQATDGPLQYTATSKALVSNTNSTNQRPETLTVQAPNWCLPQLGKFQSKMTVNRSPLGCPDGVQLKAILDKTEGTQDACGHPEAAAFCFLSRAAPADYAGSGAP